MPSITVSSFIHLSSILLEIFSDKLTIAKIRRDITLYLLVIVIELQFLHSALSLMAVYQCISFSLIPLLTLRDMLRTNFKGK